MTEEESPFSPFLSTTFDDLSSIVKELDPPRTLLIKFSEYSFFQRAFNNQSKLLFEAVKTSNAVDESDQNGAGTVISLCVDDPEDVEYEVEVLKKLPNRKRAIIICPRLTAICERAIEPIKADISVYELHTEVLPLDKFSFLVPSEHSFARCFVEDDITDVYNIARALLKIELINGCPTRTFTIGPMSKRVNELSKQLRGQIGDSYFNAERQFDELFIFDRTADLYTPLVTQTSYAGIIDDKFVTKYGYIYLPGEVKLDLEGNVQKCVPLSDEDEVFDKLRHLHIAKASEVLTDLLQEMADLKAPTGKLQKSLKDSIGSSKWRKIKKYCEDLVHQKPWLEMHTGLMTQALDLHHLFNDVLNFEFATLKGMVTDPSLISNLMMSERWIDALRMLCLTCLTSRVPDQDLLRDVENKLIGRMGFEFGQDIIRLQKLGMLTESSFKSFFPTLIKKKTQTPGEQKAGLGVKFSAVSNFFNLIVESNENLPINTKNPQEDTIYDRELSEGYSGYIPLLVRLVMSALRSEWRESTADAKMLKDMGLQYEVDGRRSMTRRNAQGKPVKRYLIFVIGGVTATEISTFRKLGKILDPSGGTEFCIGSTNITSGKKILLDICPHLPQTP